MPTPSILGRRVRSAREAAGLTQEDLAHHIGVRLNTIARLEQGRIQDLSGENIARLADALSVSADYLLGRTDTSQDPTAAEDA